MSAKVKRIDFSKKFLKAQAEKLYGEGDFIGSLRFALREFDSYGADGDLYVRLADIYENLGLHTSAINYWFKFVDGCDTEDLPDAYEGLAVNYLNLGNEAQSAYYYNKLIDADASLTREDKMQIAETFAKEKSSGFRFVYPPEVADYRAETALGAAALKNGDLKRAIAMLSQVKKGAKEYAAAQDMLAVAQLLKGDSEEAECICRDLLRENPDDVQALSTLSAIYAEEDRREESRAIADRLCAMTGRTLEEKYKIATVACENGLHERALEIFDDISKEIPCDGNLLYFKAVAAAECGKDALAERVFSELTDIYPDAETAKYYLRRLRLYKAYPEAYERPPFTYFYKVPQEEKERRAGLLEMLLKLPLKSVEPLAADLEKEGVFRWCFDEMDGMETELQLLAAAAAAHAGNGGYAPCDEFLRDVLLDCEVKDALKIEILRLLFERGEEISCGIVVCHVYKRIDSPKLRFGRSKRKAFLRGYAEIASKFAILGEGITERIANTAERLYEDLSDAEYLEAVKTPSALAAAIYAEAGLTEAGYGTADACALFSASKKETEHILSVAEIVRELKRTGAFSFEEGAEKVAKNEEERKENFGEKENT